MADDKIYLTALAKKTVKFLCKILFLEHSYLDHSNTLVSIWICPLEIIWKVELVQNAMECFWIYLVCFNRIPHILQTLLWFPVYFWVLCCCLQSCLWFCSSISKQHFPNLCTLFGNVCWWVAFSRWPGCWQKSWKLFP